MKAAGVVLGLNYVAYVCAASDGLGPRGVSPDFARHYKDASTFTCISNPSIKLPFARVNDDYCDCPDGSDEPGTSACSHLSPLSPQTPAGASFNTADTTLALPGFYCQNKGHIPGYVPFTSVNDGICDYDLCCDGTEEWDGVGGVRCEDRCKDIGKEWRKKEEARQKSLGNAVKKRQELVTQAKRLKKEVEDRVKTIQTQIEGAELKVKQMEQEVGDLEQKERSKVVQATSGQKSGGKLGILADLAKRRIDELREHLGQVRMERNEYSRRVMELEDILSTFKQDYNPNFNDEGVKRAVRAWEDYAAQEELGASQDSEEDLNQILRPDNANGLDWSEFEEEESKDTDVLYAFENYLPPSVRDWLDRKLRDVRVALIDAGILAEASKSGSESKALVDGRARLQSAIQNRDDLREDIKSHKEDLRADFGPDDIFRALKGTCVSSDSGEYTYEVCFWDKTTQKPKKGGGHTNMGNFVRLETITVDDVLPADGKGLGSGVRLVMKYENGNHCWNGPNRSSAVVLACAEETELWKIMEEEKCVYRLEVGTPAACEVAGASSPPDHGKDEL